MAKTATINWGAGFALNTSALLAEAQERAKAGAGRVMNLNPHPRWVPAQGGKADRHPMSAGAREKSGRPARDRTVVGRQGEGRADPTPETLYRLGHISARQFAAKRMGVKPAEISDKAWERMMDEQEEAIERDIIQTGPSCQIERLLWCKLLDEDQAEALRRWAALLSRAALLGKPSQSGLTDFVDGSRGAPLQDSKREEAFRQVKAIWEELDGEEIRHLGRVVRQEAEFNIGHVRNGARTLARILIGGAITKRLTG